MCDHTFCHSESNIEEVISEVKRLKNAVNGAYGERNIMVLVTALVINDNCKKQGVDPTCGWYNDSEGEEGFKRIISLNNGKYTFHIPDDFNVGRLPITRPNWDGHTTAEKYRRLEAYCND